ncbi:MAG: molybdopterin-dependent oxidoreductase [Chlorobi bacterium]|nr:molybdopterin-dependent oxidoreductase [Chlorobiota bacterium]
MKLRRRDFLKTSAVVGAGAMALSPAVGAFAKKTGKKGKNRSGEWHATTCQGCTTWCPVEVFVQDGRAVKVRGNQNSAINPGTTCPRGHMIPKQMYDPDRIKTPMKRTNPAKGRGVDPQFVPISWDEALGTIADKMMELRAANETHKFVLLRGRYSYSRDIIYSALTKVFGSPNGISHSSICAEAEKSGAFFTQGFWGYRDYDLKNCKYVVFWGVDPFRSNRQVPRAMDELKVLQENGKIATIDPMLTGAAAKSDVWLAPKPGTDGALASAMAHHILVNGLWDRTFVGDFINGGSFEANTPIDEASFAETETFGLAKWWNIELLDKTPEWASAITGIDAEKIKYLSEQLASAAPYVSIWYGPGATMNPRGTYTAMSIYALNGLLGSIDHEGGPLQDVSSSVNGIPSYSDYQDEIAIEGTGYPKIDQRGTYLFPALKKGHSGKGVVTNNVANALNAADPYDVKAIIGYWCNFPYSGTENQRWVDALSNLPFFAHITTNASEMTQFADIVLPAAFSATEKLSYLKVHGNLHTEISIQQPLAERVFDVRADENEITYKLSIALRERGFANLNDYFNNEFKDPETGATPTNEYEFAEYATKLFTKPSYDTLSGGWNEYLEKGVVTTGPYEFKSHWGDFHTETKKFEFYSETLKKALGDHADKYGKTIDELLTDTNYIAQGELAFVPHYEEQKRWGSEEEYPFAFIDVRSRFNREGRSQNLPWYNIFRRLDPGDMNWEDRLRMNPADAAALGLADGDDVIVSTVKGSHNSKLLLWEGIQPGTVAKTYGPGHWAYGRFASKDYANHIANGLNNNEVLIDDYDRISGSTARNGGFVGVKIEKA